MHLHDLNSAPTGSCVIETLFSIRSHFVLMKPYDGPNHLDTFTAASSGSPTVNESFHVRAPESICARRTSEAARAILRFVYSCVYLPVLILAITRMAGHVKGRFAHSQ